MLVVVVTSALSLAFEKFLRSQQSDRQINHNIDQLLAFRQQLSTELITEDFTTIRHLLGDNPQYESQFLIFDDYDNEILGRENLRKLPFRQHFDHPLMNEFKARQLQLFTEIISDSGAIYYIELSPKISFTPLLSPRFSGAILRFILWFLLTAIVCYALTRALTKQIHLLQRATQRLADGDFHGAFPPHYRFSHDELGQLGKDFQRMASQLDASQRARKQMLSDISHELRSPLARMQVALEIARTRLTHTPPTDNFAQLERLETEIVRLNTLIGQIIHIQQLQLDNVVKADWVLLNQLLTTIVADVNYEYQQQDKRANFSLASENIKTLGDANLLHSALENIVRNAMSHTAQYSIVNIELSIKSNNAIITICDQGSGIPAADSARIFQPFVRLDSSRNRQTGGYGLGLFISKAVIEKHGGSIVVNNHAEGGLVVTVSLLIA